MTIWSFKPKIHQTYTRVSRALPIQPKLKNSPPAKKHRFCTYEIQSTSRTYYGIYDVNLEVPRNHNRQLVLGRSREDLSAAKHPVLSVTLNIKCQLLKLPFAATFNPHKSRLIYVKLPMPGIYLLQIIICLQYLVPCSIFPYYMYFTICIQPDLRQSQSQLF